jgi:4-amino-4-deoxy-L-arabinose transferase-like glycosyltransferase
MGSGRRLHSNRVFGTIGRFLDLQEPGVWIAVAIAVALAAWRRVRGTLILAGGVVAWVVVEIAFALHGWPGLPRYMFEAAAIAVILAGAGVGWVLLEAPRLRRGLPRWAGLPVVAVLVATLVPGAVGRVRTERTDLKHERGRTHEIALLNTTIDVLGGYRHIRACGEPVTIVEYASALAWYTHLNVGSVGYLPDLEKQRSYPIVLLLPNSTGGWRVQPWHTRPSQVAACKSLHANYLISAQEPGGFLVRQ